MIVKTHREGRDRTGLLVGIANARRYFRKDVQSIDLRLDDLQIQCVLSPDFWDEHPEIHDPRLSEWLEFKVGPARRGREPMLSMVPSGVNAFVITSKPKQRNEAFGDEIFQSPEKSHSRPFLCSGPFQPSHLGQSPSETGACSQALPACSFSDQSLRFKSCEPELQNGSFRDIAL